MAWIFLFIAGGLEVFWSVCLKLSEGFTVLKFTIPTIVGMILSFVFLSQAKLCPWERHMPYGQVSARWVQS